MFPARIIDGSRYRARQEEILAHAVMPEGVEFLFGAQQAFLKGPNYHYNADELRRIADTLDEMGKEIYGDNDGEAAGAVNLQSVCQFDQH